MHLDIHVVSFQIAIQSQHLFTCKLYIKIQVDH